MNQHLRSAVRTTLGRMAVVVAVLTTGWAQTTPPGKPVLPIPVEASVPAAPIVFEGDGNRLLCYEIYLTNISGEPWFLQSIEADSGDGAMLQKIEGKELEATLRHPGKADVKGDEVYAIAPGEQVIVYMWVKLAGKAPAQLQHEITYHRGGDTKPLPVTAALTTVSENITAITSPLRGKNWLAGNGPSNTSGHRRTIIVIGGVPYIAQRYAIDWVQVDEQGVTHKGAESDNKNYFCYGSEALAVADATVVEVKNGIAENVPGDTRAVAMSLSTVAGNHVNLDLGGGVYAMYAHLQPDSIRVNVGDKVKRGQVIGLVGNSGNSTEPHLHFQLMNHNSPLGSEGLPYKMTFQVTGSVADLDHPKMERLAAPKKLDGEIPVEGEVVDF